MKLCSFFVVCGTIVASNGLPGLPYFITSLLPYYFPTFHTLLPYPIAEIRATCVDELPQDYGTVRGQCVVGWTCSDWAGKGSHSSTDRCLHDWINYRLCVPKSNGQVKDYCKKSCGTCVAGKFIHLFSYLFI